MALYGERAIPLSPYSCAPKFRVLPLVVFLCVGPMCNMEKEMATHSSIFTWRISWTDEPGRLPSMSLQRVGHDLSDDHSLTHSYVTAHHL